MKYSLFFRHHQTAKLSPLLEGPKAALILPHHALNLENACWVS